MAGGPAFGQGLDRAVRDFQQRNGLLVDGEVGSETFGALSGALPSPSPIAAARPDLSDLKLDAPKKRGSSGEKVRLIQGWLSLHGFKLVVDGGYGNATARQVRAFQKANGLPVTGIVDGATYEELVQPMIAALSPIAPDGPLGRLVVAYARQHLVQHPQEVGGETPWPVGPPVHTGTGGKRLALVCGLCHVHPRAGMSRRRRGEPGAEDPRLRRDAGVCRRSVPVSAEAVAAEANHAGQLLPEAESPRRQAEVRPHRHRGAGGGRHVQEHRGEYERRRLGRGLRGLRPRSRLPGPGLRRHLRTSVGRCRFDARATTASLLPKSPVVRLRTFWRACGASRVRREVSYG